MKKRLALILLAALLALSVGARAEFEPEDFDTDIFTNDIFDGASAVDGFEGSDIFGEWEDAAEDEFGNSFDVTFDDGGYNGEWVSVDDLEIEFFLPEGWQQGTPAEDEYFFAENEDGTAELGISLFDDSFDGEELSDWAAEALDGEDYVVGMANALEVAIVTDEEMGRIVVLVPSAESNIVAFDFYRESENVLSSEFALEIAGTCTDLWF